MTVGVGAAHAKPSPAPQTDPEPPRANVSTKRAIVPPTRSAPSPVSKPAIVRDPLHDRDPLPPTIIPTRTAKLIAQAAPAKSLRSGARQLGTVAQNRPSAPLPSATPGGSSAPVPGTPSPTIQRPTPTTGTPSPAAPTFSPIPTGTPLPKSVPVPDRLNPSANPLQFPTRPSEVQVRSTQAITLQQAIQLAERNNRDLEISRLQVEQSRFAIQEARSGSFPTLGLTAGVTRSGTAFITQDNQQNNFLQQLGLDNSSGSSSATRTNFSTGLQLSYDLFTSGARPALIRSAERRSRALELQLEQTREDTRLQVSNFYYNLQNADSQVSINEAAVRNAEANLRDSRAQETAGLGTRFDTLRAEVNLANAQQQLRNAQGTQEIARRQLVQLLSLSETVTLVSADPVQPAGSWTLPLEDSIVLAYKNRAELEQQLVQRDLSEEQIRLARAQNGPTLSATAA